MKKTLFLSAILGAALCSTAMGAASLTTDSSVVGDVTYSGGVFTLAGPGTNFSRITNSADVASTNGTFAVGDSIAWQAFASNQDQAKGYGHTLHLTTAGTYTTDFSPFSFGGLIVDADLASVTLGREGTATEIVANGAANMTIGSDTTILGNDIKDSLRGVTIQTGGTWTIAEGKTLSLSATTQGVHFADGANVTLAGTGTLNFIVTSTVAELTGNGFASTSYTIGDHITQGDATLKLNGQAATLADGVLTATGTTYYVKESASFNKASMSSYATATAFEIGDGATLCITEKTKDNNGIIKGNVTVKTGGVLQLDVNDALGWSGNNVKALVVENGAEVKLTHDSNETFGGALTLQGNGKITGNNARWDFFTDSSISVAANANAAINTNELQLRHAGSQATISLGNGATLAIGANITNGDRGDGVLVITANNGSNSVVNLNGGAEGVALNFGGVTANIDSDMTLTQLMLSKNNALTTVNVAACKTVTITGTNMASSNGSFELANWARNNVLNIEGTVIANSGITTEGGNACPVVNIKNGGTLTMNAGLNAVRREGGSGYTTINVESGATLNVGGTEDLANTNLITVNVKDGATLGGAYGSGTEAVINKNFALAENATVTLQTAAEKQLTLNGTFGTATNTLIVQGGGTVSLGAATAALSSVTLKENTGLIFAGDTTIGNGLTMGTGSSIENNGALTLNGAVALVGTSHTSAEVVPTTSNGYGSTTTTATLSDIIGGTVVTTGVTSWTLNGHAAELVNGVLTYTSATNNYYVVTTDTGVTEVDEDVSKLNLTSSTTISDSEFAVSDFMDIAGNKTIAFSGSNVTISGNQGVWIHSGSVLNLDSTSSITADGLTISGGTITKGENGSDAAQIGSHSTAAFHSGVVLSDSDITADGTFVRNYTVNGGSLTITKENTTVNAALDGTDLILKADASAQFSETAHSIGALTLNAGANVTLGDAESHSATLTITGLTVNGSASIDADLVMNGGTITFADNATLTMGCAVTIGSTDAVTVVLTQDMVDAVATNGYYDLFTSVETATLGNIVFVAADGVTLNDGTTYSLQWDGSRIYVAPEPATATLSLLALAALCARRKRH